MSNPVNVNLGKTQGLATIIDADRLFYDDFSDGVVNWDNAGGWHEAGGILHGSSNHSATAFARIPWTPSGASGCTVCSIETDMQVTGGRNKIFLEAWYTDDSNRVELIMAQQKGKWVLKQRSGGHIVAKARALASLSPNVNYHVKLSFDGNNFILTVDGAQLTVMPSGGSASGNVGLKVKKTTAIFGPISIY